MSAGGGGAGRRTLLRGLLTAGSLGLVLLGALRPLGAAVAVPEAPPEVLSGGALQPRGGGGGPRLDGIGALGEWARLQPSAEQVPARAARSLADSALDPAFRVEVAERAGVSQALVGLLLAPRLADRALAACPAVEPDLSELCEPGRRSELALAAHEVVVSELFAGDPVGHLSAVEALCAMGPAGAALVAGTEPPLGVSPVRAQARLLQIRSCTLPEAEVLPLLREALASEEPGLVVAAAAEAARLDLHGLDEELTAAARRLEGMGEGVFVAWAADAVGGRLEATAASGL